MSESDRCPDRQAARRSEAGCRRCRSAAADHHGRRGRSRRGGVAGLPAGRGGARDTLADAQETALAKVRAAGRAADDYVHDNPWRSIGIAAGFGLVVGLLIGRR